MRSAICFAICVLLAGAAVAAGDPDDVQPSPRRATFAWRITSGSFDGVQLDGLTVVAFVDRHSAVIEVDRRATPTQRQALANLVRELSDGAISTIARVDTAPFRFATFVKYVDVEVPDTFEAAAR